MADKPNVKPEAKTENKTAPKFGAVAFSRPRNAAVYDNKGGKSTPVVMFSVPILGAGIIVDGTMYGREVKTSDGFDVHFVASLPKGVGASSRTDEDAFLSHIELSAQVWAGWDDATGAAVERLTGIKAKVSADSPKVERPRLVVKPSVERPAALPTA